MILFTVPSSPFGARIQIQAVAKGLALTIAEPPGGLGSREFLAVNPFGKAPVLRTDGGDIIESGVIQEYLEDCHPEPNLRGNTPLQVATVRSFVRAVDLYLFPALFELRGRVGGARDGLSKAIEEFGTVVDRLARLERADHLRGLSLTLADCALAPAYFYADLFAERLGFRSPFERHPVFTTWWMQANGDPAVASVIANLARIAAAPREAASE